MFTAMLAVLVAGTPLETAQSLDTNQVPVQLVARDSGAISLTVGESRTVNLVPFSLRAPGFRVRVAGADGILRSWPAPPVETYRGRITGEHGSRVAASVHAGAVDAVMYDQTGACRWVLRPVDRAADRAVPPRHQFRNLASNSVRQAVGRGDCANPTPPDGGAGVAPRDLAEQEMRIVEIACDADYEFFQQNGGSIDATVQDIEMILNGASAIYELDIPMKFTITEVIVRTEEPDPYTLSNPYALLNQFKAWWQANHSDVPRDIITLFTGIDLDGSTVGIADAGGVCFLGAAITQSRWSTDLDQRIALYAHEIGHIFDAVHCDYGDEWCRIMCASIGACTTGVHSFSPSQVARIRSYAAGWTCLDTAPVTILRTELPFFDGFTSGATGIAPDPLRWAAVDLATCSYNRLNIAVGRSYGEEFKRGTIRTRPMAVHSPVHVSYKVRPYYVDTGDSLIVEWLDSNSLLWNRLDRIVAPGGAPADYTLFEHTLGPEAYGECFAVRFSGSGSQSTSGDRWIIDDMSIEPAGIPGDLDGDCDVDLADLSALLAHFGTTSGASLADGDLDGDSDVDLSDLSMLLSAFGSLCP